MAIKDRRDTAPKRKHTTDIKTEIAIAKYETYGRQTANIPVRPRKP